MINNFSVESRERLLAGVKKSSEVHKLRKYQRIEEYKKSPIQCSECKISLSYEQRLLKFCSRSCSVKQNNRLRKKSKSHNCPECGLLTENINFCSKSCQGLSIKNNVYKQIEQTKSFFGCGKEKARQYLISMRGHRCEICNQTEWMGQPIPLVRDHINGNSDDERLENNRMICCNCDAQTPTYKYKNKGNGRAIRRKRYAEGKSY